MDTLWIPTNPVTGQTFPPVDERTKGLMEGHAISRHYTFQAVTEKQLPAIDPMSVQVAKVEEPVGVTKEMEVPKRKPKPRKTNKI